MISLKQKTYEYCRKQLHQKLLGWQNNLQELLESAANETKSTAGDKHETALAMLQIEQENIQRQIHETNEQIAALNRIDIAVFSSVAVTGSLIKTDKGHLFLSIGLGKINIDDIIVIVLSPASPLGHKLIGSSVNDTIEMNATNYKIEAIS